jgi:hypothetical protein
MKPYSRGSEVRLILRSLRAVTAVSDNVHSPQGTVDSAVPCAVCPSGPVANAALGCGDLPAGPGHDTATPHIAASTGGTLRTIHYTLHPTHYTLHTTHYTLHTTNTITLLADATATPSKYTRCFYSTAALYLHV